VPVLADNDVVVHGNAARVALRATLLTSRLELIDVRFNSNFLARHIVGRGRHHHRVAELLYPVQEPVDQATQAQHR
jgi:hypothetical protein